MSFHCACDLHHSSNGQRLKHFEFQGILSFYKILKIRIFGKLTGCLGNFPQTAKKTNKMHS